VSSCEMVSALANKVTTKDAWEQGRTQPKKLRACSVIFNPYGLEGIDTDWRGF
jgi:hypothetical protein